MISAKNIYYFATLAVSLLFSRTYGQTGNVSIHSDPRLAVLLTRTKSAEPLTDAAPTARPEKNKIAGKNKVQAKENSANETKQPKYTYKPEAQAEAEEIAERIKESKTVTAATGRPTEPGKTIAAKSDIARKIVEKKPAKDIPHEEHHAVRGVSGGPRYAGKGFRVQIYYGPNRQEALKRKSEFMHNYPGIPTYLTFASPHYHVKVGDFRQRDDALGMLKEANGTYSPCMIVPDNISIGKN